MTDIDTRVPRTAADKAARVITEVGAPWILNIVASMIIGMAPMALALGEGGEQNAPLGRAVIGGLIFATTASLFLVPVIFSNIHGRPGRSVPSAPVTRGPAHVV